MYVAGYFVFFIFGTSATPLQTIKLGKSIRDGESLVSTNGTFELAFFSPGNSTKRYLGIWYTIVSEKTVAWVANRETSLSNGSGVLNFTDQGILVLHDSTDRIIWSSNSTSRKTQNPVVQLLDSGNLVVKDANDNDPESFLWQSFDHPSDNLLPKMKLGRNIVTGKDNFLTSWKSKEDPSPGEFSLWIDPRGFPQMVLQKGTAVHYRAGSWNGLGFTGTPRLSPIPLCDFQFVINDEEVYYKCEPKGSTVSRLSVSQSGLVEHSVHISKTHSWSQVYYAPVDECDIYSRCGANTRCYNRNC